MKKEDKKFIKLIIIHIILILILLGLTIKIKLQEKNYNCNNCQIRFTNQIGFDSENKLKTIFYENITRMYDYYIKGYCSVEYSEGHYIGGLINQTFKNG